MATYEVFILILQFKNFPFFFKLNQSLFSILHLKVKKKKTFQTQEHSLLYHDA